MREIDVLLDGRPALAMEMVTLDRRNRQAHAELQAFNEHGVFVNKHPIVTRRKQYDDQLSELYELKRSNPAALITEIANVMQNARRIESNLNRKKYKDGEEKESWEQNLSRANIRKKVLEDVIAK
jgi:hypothetical protein